MKKEFVPYEQALALKELGFDEPCFGWFKNNEFTTSFNDLYPKERGERFEIIKAPTFSQCFRWFREKYEYDGYFYSNTSYRFRIVIKKTFTMENLVDIIVDTHEEAELECLIKLIELAKSK